MSDVLKVSILRAFAVEDFEAEWVFVSAKSGDFVVYPDHASILSGINSLEPLKIKLIGGDVKEFLFENAVFFKDIDNVVFIYD